MVVKKYSKNKIRAPYFDVLVKISKVADAIAVEIVAKLLAADTTNFIAAPFCTLWHSFNQLHSRSSVMADEIRSADLLAKNIIETPGVLAELQAKPEETILKLLAQAKQQVPSRALEQDKLIYRIVVSSLGLVTLLVVVGVIALAFKATANPVPIPDVLTALGSAAIGALAGILAPSPATKS